MDSDPINSAYHLLLERFGIEESEAQIVERSAGRKVTTVTSTLVLGGTGLLGSHTITELLGSGYDVTAVSLPGSRVFTTTRKGLPVAFISWMARRSAPT